MAIKIIESIPVAFKFASISVWGLFFVLALGMAASALQAQQQTVEFREAAATVDSFTLHYRIGGSGPVLLMLHGFTLTGEQWVPFAKAFAESYTVVIADLPGHGGSSPLPGAFSYEKTARLMLGLLDTFGVEQVRGIGHSAGGITLLHMAAQQPQRLKAMVLIDAPHYFGPEIRKIARDDKLELLKPEVQEWYRTIHPGGEDQAVQIFQQYNGLEHTHEQITPEVLAALPVRTLLVWGNRDPAFPLEIPLELYRALPNAALWVIPGQGHTPLWVDMGGDPGAADRFVEISGDFLAGELKKADWF